MNARDLARLQEDQNLKSTLRSGKTGTRLLDDAENNIGNSIVLEPQILPAGQIFTVIPQSISNNGRLLNLTSSSKTGQSITVVITASKISNQGGFTGPYTAIAEFGNGVVTTRVEFDVPFGPFHSVTGIVGTSADDQPQDSGAIIQLPTGILRLFARYDNAFITPEIGGYAFGGPGSPVPIPNISGPFAPNNSQPIPISPAPLTTKAFATYFGRIHTKLYKTQYVYVGVPIAPVSFLYTGAPLPQAYYCIPPFAKSVRVVRQPQTAALILKLIDTSSQDFPGESYNIPSGISPTIPIEGNETVVSLTSATAGGADKVSFVKLVYEIAF